METKMTHADMAEALFREGYNCAQSVFAAFSDVCGMDRETALRLSSSFGGGLGRLREVCGAVSGMAMVAGVLRGYSDPNDPEAKAAHYALIREMADRFRAETGSIICRELLEQSGNDASAGGTPSPRDEHFHHSRPCAGFVRLAASIAEDMLL